MWRVNVPVVTAAALDQPTADRTFPRESIPVCGWLTGPRLRERVQEIQAVTAGRVVARSRTVLRRPDVAAALEASEDDVVGFELSVRLPDDVLVGENEVTVDVLVVEDETGAGIPAVRTTAVVLATALTERHYYGVFLDDSATRVLHRDDVYRSGPSAPHADPTCAALVLRRLEPGSSVLDVGCGVGAYHEPLAAAGHDWFGVEVDDGDCAAMAAAGLPHRQIEPGPLPFADGQFDYAIAIEVLEHVRDPEPFVAELRRVTKRGAVLSVPNLEAVPMYQTVNLVPWHLLESDHHNFFSRASLATLLETGFPHVDVVPYGELPVRTSDGAVVYNHLLASAMVSTDRS